MNLRREFSSNGMYEKRDMDEGANRSVTSEEMDGLNQAIADKVLQRITESNIPMTITINPLTGSAPYGNCDLLAPQPHRLNGPCASIIGLMAFGMTTVLLNLVNIGKYELGSVLPGMAIPFGGLAQLIAGLLEYFNGNNFGCIAFMSYGSFWISLAFVWILPPTKVIPETEGGLLGVYLILWGIFTLCMFFCTLRKNVSLAIVFGSLVLLFFFLGFAEITGNEPLLKVSAVVGVICGCSAMYTSMAELLENQFGREILPLISLPLKRNSP